LFRALGRLSSEFDHLWAQERQWLEGEKERAKRSLRGATKQYEAIDRKITEAQSRREELNSEAASLEDTEALTRRRDELQSEAAVVTEGLSQAEMLHTEVEQKSKLSSEECSEVRLKLEDAEAAVSNAKSMESAARAKANNSREGLQSWASEVEERAGDHLKVLANEVLQLRELALANTRADKAFESESYIRGPLREQAQELVRKLQDLDHQLNVAPDSFSSLSLSEVPK